MKFYRSIRYLGYNLFGGYKALFLFLRFKQRILNPQAKNEYITKHHQICLTGPPRSANTFALNIFRLWNPECNLAHHVHLPAQALYAVKWNIPCIVLIRKPLDAITSLVVPGKLTVGTAILSYFWFYYRLRKVRGRVLIIKFEDVIRNPQVMIERTNWKYNTDFSSSNLTENQIEEVFVRIRDNPNRKSELMIAIPDPKKDINKNLIKIKVKRHPFFPVANRIYSRWLKTADRYENID